MRRHDIHTGDLLAWSDHRDGISHPGIALGPIPTHNCYGGNFSRAFRGGGQYLVLTPNQRPDGMAARKTLDVTVDGGRTEPGDDFWGLGEHLLDYVKLTLATMEEADEITGVGIPDGWNWRRIPGQMLRGNYVTWRAVDVRRSRDNEEEQDRKAKNRTANRTRMDRVRERVAALDLDQETVTFAHWDPSEENPGVTMPMLLLEMLLDAPQED